MIETDIDVAARAAAQRQVEAFNILCRQHEPMVEHHYAARSTFARCVCCGVTASPVHWPTADNPPTSTDDALNNFRQELGHAD